MHFYISVSHLLTLLRKKKRAKWNPANPISDCKQKMNGNYYSCKYPFNQCSVFRILILPDEDFLKVNGHTGCSEYFTHTGHQVRSYPISWYHGDGVTASRFRHRLTYSLSDNIANYKLSLHFDITSFIR